MIRSQGRRRAMVRAFLCAAVLMAFGTIGFAQGKRYLSDQAWSFGVMADTQWTLGRPGYSPDVFGSGGTPGYLFMENENPEFISESLARQVRQAMIQHGVKFMFQMGDHSNWGGARAAEFNASAVQDLYDAGIGYFPMRGNHETYSWMVGDFVNEEGSTVFYSYDPDFNYNIPDWLATWPQTQGLENTFGATNFSSPSQLIAFDYTGAYESMEFVDNADLMGLSYSFDYGTAGNNARFVVMDVESTGWVSYTDEDEQLQLVGSNYAPAQQQSWISERLNRNSRGTEHAFILSHRQSLGQNHKEGFFGGLDPNPWFESLVDNGVRYHITAHDHMHNRSKLYSPDQQSRITQVISGAVSTKFYSPGGMTVDQELREMQVSQELSNAAYYIYTVDGPRVTVDYYSDETGNLQSDYCYPYGVAGEGSCSQRRTGRSDSPEVMGTWETPTFNFVKKESFGYSLNGREFVVEQGGSYEVVQDSFSGTTARILAGINTSTSVDATPNEVDDNDTPDDPEDDIVSAPRPLVKTVNTGWTAKPADARVLSPVFSLWGLSDFGTEQTDYYVLSLSFDITKDLYIKGGGIGIAALNANNEWVNAVDLNTGGRKRFVLGPYSKYYGIGTYGIDYASKTAWAVLNYNADFVVYSGVENAPRRFWRINE